jgi:hypothetical protein
LSGFWADVVANLIGTFAGAGLALLSSWVLSMRVARRRETRLLQSIIDRLARSRVFTHTDVGDHVGALSAGQVEDSRRSTESILASREHIGLAMSEFGADSDVRQALEDMYGACALYLHSVENDPNGYVRAICDLREVLGGMERELHQLRPRLRLKMPGESAFPAAV